MACSKWCVYSIAIIIILSSITKVNWAHALEAMMMVDKLSFCLFCCHIRCNPIRSKPPLKWRHNSAGSLAHAVVFIPKKKLSCTLSSTVACSTVMTYFIVLWHIRWRKQITHCKNIFCRRQYVHVVQWIEDHASFVKIHPVGGVIPDSYLLSRVIHDVSLTVVRQRLFSAYNICF